MYLLSQGGKDAFSLSREDLSQRQVSVHFNDIDLAYAAEQYSPPAFSAADMSKIPVYHREKNKINLFPRIVSLPDRLSLASPSSLCLPLLPENATSSQPATDTNLGDTRLDQTIPQSALQELTIETSPDTAAVLDRADIPYNKQKIQSLPAGAAEIREAWPYSYTQGECKSEPTPQHPPVLRNTNDQHNKGLASPADFPWFVPEFQSRPLTKCRYHSKPLSHDSLTFNARANHDKYNHMDTPETTCSSRMSGFYSPSVVNTCASSDTELSSADDDISSYYEEAGELGCPMEDKLFDRPSIDDNAPPIPPRHQRRCISECAPKTNHKLRPFSKNVGKPLDFCLDLGADYDKSRFMIPAENRVAAPKSRVMNGPNAQILIKKRALDKATPVCSEATNNNNRYRGSISGAGRIFSGIKAGISRIL